MPTSERKKNLKNVIYKSAAKKSNNLAEKSLKKSKDDRFQTLDPKEQKRLKQLISSVSSEDMKNKANEEVDKILNDDSKKWSNDIDDLIKDAKD
jgi:transcriptional regulator of heat shock response